MDRYVLGVWGENMVIHMQHIWPQHVDVGWNLGWSLGARAEGWVGTVDGSETRRSPPGMYKTFRKEWDKVSILTGGRRISEASTVCV